MFLKAYWLLAMATLIWVLLIYWLVIFVACFTVVEVGHDQLYDEVTPHAGIKVFGGSLLIAVLLTTLRYYGVAASFDSMFTSNIIWTVLQGLVWFGVFTLVFQFHPWHALGIGLATMLLVTGLATMGVESIMAKTPTVTTPARSLQTSKAVRQSVAPTGGGGAPPSGTTAPAGGAAAPAAVPKPKSP